MRDGEVRNGRNKTEKSKSWTMGNGNDSCIVDLNVGIWEISDAFTPERCENDTTGDRKWEVDSRE